METEENIFSNLPQRLMGLGEIAENLWWSWHPDARMVFKKSNAPRFSARRMVKEYIEKCYTTPLEKR